MLGGRIDRAIDGLRLWMMLLRAVMMVMPRVLVARVFNRVLGKTNLLKKVVDAVRR
jgi:hypothetical protein